MSPPAEQSAGTSPLDRSQLEELAGQHIRAGRLDDAERTMRSLLLAWPGIPGYWLELATILERKGMRADAASCYRDLIERQPDFAVARFNFACFLRRDGQLEEALRQHQRALDLKIEQPEEVLCNMAVIHSERHQNDNARAFLQRALAINPNYVPAIYNLGLLHEEFGNREDAVTIFNRILELDPTYHDALVRIAHAQAFRDPADPVVRKLRRALRRTTMDPLTRESLHFALGKVLDDCGAYDEAFAEFQLGNKASAVRLRRYSRAGERERTSQIVATFNADWLSRVRPVSDRALVFVTGMFRSGSTLFEQVLAAHPRVTAGGEIDYFARLLNQLAQSGTPFPAGYGDIADETWQRLGSGYLEYLDETFPGAGLVTNKRPDAFALLGLFKGLFPNARFINTVRDPLDTCLSIYVQQLDDRIGYANDLENIAHHFVQHRRLLEHWKELFGDSIFDAVYDEYVLDREPTTRALLRFLDLEWNDTCLEPRRSRNRVRTASLWQVREPVYQKSSGRWRNYARHLEGARQILER